MTVALLLNYHLIDHLEPKALAFERIIVSFASCLARIPKDSGNSGIGPTHFIIVNTNRFAELAFVFTNHREPLKHNAHLQMSA